MLEVCGQGRCGAVSLLADGQCGHPKGKLQMMGLCAFSLCHGRISLLWSAARPLPTQLGCDLAAGADTEQRGICCSAVVCKNFLWAPLFLSTSIATKCSSVQL